MTLPIIFLKRSLIVIGFIGIWITIIEISIYTFFFHHLYKHDNSEGLRRLLDKETIIDDYLLTNDFYKGPTVGNNWKEEISETIRPLFEARLDYINAAFNEINSRHKRIEDFVLNELDVDIKTIENIKNKILE